MSFAMAASVHARDVDLALDIADGETVAVLGPNGAGKSTLLNVVAGLVAPDAGFARLNDRVLYDADGAATRGKGRVSSSAARPAPARPIGRGARRRSLRPHERGVALLAQEALLFPHLTARDNVAFGPRSTGRSRRDAHRIADEWLDRVDASDLAERHPTELSGGQAQRVAVARALAVDPSLLLLDEPMAALDVSVAPAMRRLLRDVLRGRMAVIVTHDVLDAVMLADRVVLLEAGRVVDSGPTRDVLERPTTMFAAGLSGLNLLTGVQRADGFVATDSGHRVAATFATPAVVDARVGVCVRPSRVTVRVESAHTESTPTESELAGAVRADNATIRDARGPAHPESRDFDRVATNALSVTSALTATVTDLEPRGDSIRVRADAIAADVSPGTVADLDLMPGSRVRFEFVATDAVAYPL